MTTIARPWTILLISGIACALSSCGKGPAAFNGGNNAGSTSATTASGWAATDACKLLDKGIVATTLGSPVVTATLGAVKAEGNGFPLYSQCEYTLDDGRMLIFGTGQYTNNTTLAEQVADMRRQAALVAKAPVDLPGLGKAAFWAKELSAVYAFIGNDRYLSATVSQPDMRKPQATDEKIEADDIAILRKAGA